MTVLDTLKNNHDLTWRNKENVAVSTFLLLFCFSFFLAASWIKSRFGYYGIPRGDYCL